MANLIFDYDGTIHDTMKIYKDAFLKGYDYLVSENILPVKNFKDSEISKWLGYNKEEMWESFAPEIADSYKKQAGQMIADKMIDNISDNKAELYDGVEDLLIKLKKDGHKLILLTNSNTRYLERNREYFNLDRFFDDYYWAEKYNYIPKPEIFKDIKEKYKDDFIMIGDRFHDMEVAKVHNLRSIGCAYGFADEEELSEADEIAKSPSEIYDLVNKLIK
ncbi:MAG: HAD family hydrolase [Peptoniphilaceae bacterium]